MGWAEFWRGEAPPPGWQGEDEFWLDQGYGSAAPGGFDEEPDPYEPNDFADNAEGIDYAYRYANGGDSGGASKDGLWRPDPNYQRGLPETPKNPFEGSEDSADGGVRRLPARDLPEAPKDPFGESEDSADGGVRRLPARDLPEAPKDPFEGEANQEPEEPQEPAQRRDPWEWGRFEREPLPSVPDKPGPGLQRPGGEGAQQVEEEEQESMSTPQEYNRHRMRGRMQPGKDPGSLEFAELTEAYQADHGGLHIDGKFGPNTEAQARMTRQSWLDDGAPEDYGVNWGAIWDEYVDWTKPVNTNGGGGGGGGGGGVDPDPAPNPDPDPTPNPDPEPKPKKGGLGMVLMIGGGVVVLGGIAAALASSSKKKKKR